VMLAVHSHSNEAHVRWNTFATQQCQSSVDLLVYVPRGEQVGFAPSFGQVLRPTLAGDGHRGQLAAAGAVASETRVGGGVAATGATRPASSGSERASNKQPCSTE
jgi:hypothetical protein